MRVATALLLALLWASSPVGSGAAQPGALPHPEYLIAEPTPNDNGTHITVRWPRAKGAPEDFDYVLYISRDPRWRWFKCRTVSPKSGLVTDPDVAGYYPYRLYEGEEHFAIVDPTGALPLNLAGEQVQYASCILGLAKEMEHRDWAKRALGNLRGCEQLLVQLERLVAKQHSLRTKYRAAVPAWKARQLTEYINAAKEKQKDLAKKVSDTRRAFLEQAANFSLVLTLIETEASLQFAPLAGVEPERPTAAQVARLMPLLKERLNKAGKKARSRHARADDYDRYDRLRYLEHLADAYLVRAKRAVSLQQIENDLLWNLSHTTEGAELPAGAQERKETGPADSEALRKALARHNSAQQRLERDGSKEALQNWKAARESFARAQKQWAAARSSELLRRLETGDYRKPDRPCYKMEITRLVPLLAVTERRFKDIRRSHARRPFHFKLAVARKGQQPEEPFGFIATAASEPDLFDFSKLVNLLFAIVFAAAVIATMVYVRRRPQVFLRKIAGLDAVDEAIGRATEMGKPVLFVHGLTDVSSISVIASLNILSRIARDVAQYDSDLLVVNNEPVVYSVSYEVVQEGYMEAGRPDAFKPDNVVMVASEQFPYVAAVAGIMSRVRPAANLFIGYFYAESLILAEAGSLTGAIQIAATDSFTQLPFFVTTCDYTLMGEELYAASAYLSRDPKLLGTVKVQDFGKAVLLAAMPLGTALACAGSNILRVIFTAYDKIG